MSDVRQHCHGTGIHVCVWCIGKYYILRSAHNLGQLNLKFFATARQLAKRRMGERNSNIIGLICLSDAESRCVNLSAGQEHWNNISFTEDLSSKYGTVIISALLVF